jgi:hypothetical protein
MPSMTSGAMNLNTHVNKIVCSSARYAPISAANGQRTLARCGVKLPSQFITHASQTLRAFTYNAR